MMTKRHPKGLPFLFLTEMWERFGFYVVQGMLVLYMSKEFNFSDDESYALFGTFSALAYISPMIGGMLADRLLGFKSAITYGGILLSIGYALLALPWAHGFYLALATIIVSNGLFKPNISSLLGTLYAPSDPGRDTGFTIFYIGINLGVLLAGIASGILKIYFGWHISFLSASIGLLIGLLFFAAGFKWGNIHYQPSLRPINKWYLRKSWLMLYGLVAIVLVSFILQCALLAKWLLPSIGLLLLFFIFSLAMKQPLFYRKRLLLLNTLIIASILFWTLHLQMFFSVTLFIDRLVDKHIAEFNLPTQFFYTLESLFIIILGPVIAWSWHTLNTRDINPAPFTKFIIGIAFAGFGYLILATSTYFLKDNQLISPLWVMLTYLMITIGELCLSPIGLSAVTLLSPPHLTGMMMGIWFVALGFGGQFAGMLAKLASIPAAASGQPLAQLAIYHSAFLMFAVIGFAIAVGLLVIQRLLIKSTTSSA